MDIDLVIVFTYLLLTLWVGYKYGAGIKNIESFATGERSFSTAALTATISATCISGSSFLIGITYAYYDGLLDFFCASVQVITIILIAYYFVPRMEEFLGDLSVAQSMRRLYGKAIGIITALAGFILCAGMVVIQIKILATTFAYFSKIPIQVSVISCSFVMILYSMYGGIRSVISTSILQFITFMIIVPGISIIIWNNLPHNVNTNSAIYNHILSFKSISGIDYFTLFIFSLIPSFAPPFFQRITISENIKQASKALNISSYIYLIYLFIAATIGIMLFILYPKLSKEQIFPHILNQLNVPGFKGLVFIAIIAMTVSTANSHLNSLAIMLTHDFCKPLGLVKSEKLELRFVRIVTLSVGIIATFISLYFNDSIQLLHLLLFTRNFYIPIIVPPLALAILGFRPHRIVILVSMISGFGTMLIWKLFQDFSPWLENVDSLIPSTIINIIVMFWSHYFLDFGGGWIKPKNTS